jgi:anti-anti-sigma regulatory factor
MVQAYAVPGWHLEVDRGPDWLFVRPRPLDPADKASYELGEQIWALLEQTFVHRLVLEMADVERLDAKLIKQLLWLREQIHACEGIMRICGLSPQNEALLRKFDLEGQIAHYCNRESAVMGQDAPRRPR